MNIKDRSRPTERKSFTRTIQAETLCPLGPERWSVCYGLNQHLIAGESRAPGRRRIFEDHAMRHLQRLPVLVRDEAGLDEEAVEGPQRQGERQQRGGRGRTCGARLVRHGPLGAAPRPSLPLPAPPGPAPLTGASLRGGPAGRAVQHRAPLAEPHGLRHPRPPPPPASSRRGMRDRGGRAGPALPSGASGSGSRACPAFR